MTPAPALQVSRPDGAVVAVALVLHGGQERSTRPVRLGNLAAARMVPFAAALRRAGRAHGLAVATLRCGVRGWNGPLRSPVADTRWALAQLATAFGPVPVALVGHSMGGRTALYVAGHPTVRTVVGLAPWIEPGDPVGPISGRRLLIAHGDRDRVTNAGASAAFARDAEGRAESVGFVSVHGERHALLARARVWHALASGFVLATVCAVPPGRAGGIELTTVLAKALAGNLALAL
jgi:dienelactone hydrolase